MRVPTTRALASVRSRTARSVSARRVWCWRVTSSTSAARNATHCASAYRPSGGVSMMMMSYSHCAFASREAKLARDRSSSGLGGTGPAGNTDRPVSPVTGSALESSARPDSAEERPKRSGTLKMACWRGARKSASTSSVLCPSWEYTTARLAAMKLLPSRGLALVMASVRRPASGLNQRIRSWVRITRSSSTVGWNGSQAAISSLLTPSGPLTRYGNSYCLASAWRSSWSVIRFSSIAASPKRQSSSRWRASTCSASDAVSLPSSIRMAPIWRPVAAGLRAPSSGTTFSFDLSSMGRASEGMGKGAGCGARCREEPAAGRLPLGKPAERGHRQARLEVGTRAHPPVDGLEQVHHADGDQQAEHHRERRDQRDSGLRRQRRFDRRREQLHVALPGAAFEVRAHGAREHGVVVALRALDVARHRGELDAHALRLHDARLLRVDRGLDFLLALLRLLHGVAQRRHHLLHLAGELLAQRLHVGRILHVDGMVLPEVGARGLEQAFGARQVELDCGDRGACQHVGHRVWAPAARQELGGLLEFRLRVVERGARGEHLGVELVEPRRLDVQVLVGDEDALLLLEGGELVLRLRHLVAHPTQLLLEPLRGLTHRLVAQLEVHVEVRLGEAVGDLCRDLRRLVRVLDRDEVARGVVHLELLQQLVADPHVDRAEAAGVVLPHFAQLGVLGEVQVARHLRGDASALDELDLRCDVSRARGDRDAAAAGDDGLLVAR